MTSQCTRLQQSLCHILTAPLVLGQTQRFSQGNELHYDYFSTEQSSSKSFWKRGIVRQPSDTRHELQPVADALDFSPVWTRAIALLILRAVTHRLISDASYGGIRGWSRIFSVMWRAMHAELVTAGFEMKLIATYSEPLSPNSSWPARQSARIHRLHQSHFHLSVCEHSSSLLAKFRLASHSRGDSISPPLACQKRPHSFARMLRQRRYHYTSRIAGAIRSCQLHQVETSLSTLLQLSSFPHSLRIIV